MNYLPVVANDWTVFNEQFFVSYVTIQESVITQNPDGQPIYTWQDIDTLEMLPCAIAPISFGTPQKQEARQTDITSTERTWHVTIRGHYANQINDTQRAQVFRLRGDDAELLMDLNILGTEQDSHSIMTRLRCEVFSYDGKKERS